MNIFEAAALSIGEVAACVVGLCAGKTFHLDPKKAQKIGEYIVLGVIFGAAVLVTVIYS